MDIQSARAEIVACPRCGRAVANGLVRASCQSLLFQTFAADDSNYRRDLNIRRFPEYGRFHD